MGLLALVVGIGFEYPCRFEDLSSLGLLALGVWIKICCEYPGRFEDPSGLVLLPLVVGICCEYPHRLRHPIWMCPHNLCPRD